MALPPHAIEWMNRAEIDYIGPFVKAWAAFNAWFRHASREEQERAMLNWVKNQPNAIRRGILPLLREDNDTADAIAFQQAVSALLQRLDDIHLEIIRKGVRERVSLRTVCINPRNLNQERLEHRRHEFSVRKIAGGHIEIRVVSTANAQEKFKETQERYDPAALYELATFRALSEDQQTKLRELYDSCNPRPMADLLRNGAPPLQIGAVQFQCTDEQLFSGLIETLYAMRNALLHGEMDPDPRVLACYEPAYRVVMIFLSCVR
ncbi:hypothetical protein [Cereibacter johrii]|uniref:Apea-like HEPN domain-containing protein n=1 Tax=Cereibacter johrii TaxID=445629 RepID=A0ABX5JA71_9RHOB|nr:hypothetical protein [Cereibacter johrii]ODM44899.1 hypothetical protein A9O63_03815 [Cereibacter johrii]PTM77191.1 hypothetical protein C8J29_106117 [Cereibacter johrii]